MNASTTASRYFDPSAAIGRPDKMSMVTKSMGAPTVGHVVGHVDAMVVLYFWNNVDIGGTSWQRLGASRTSNKMSSTAGGCDAILDVLHCGNLEQSFSKRHWDNDLNFSDAFSDHEVTLQSDFRLH